MDSSLSCHLLAAALGALAVLVAPAAGAEPTDGEPVPTQATALAEPTIADQVARYHGVYHHAGGEADETGRIDAIEGVVAQMSRIIRGVARRRLTSATVIPSVYTIQVDGEQVTIAIDDGRAWTTDLQGTRYSFIHDGEPFEMGRRWIDGAIQADAEQKVGAATYHFRLSDDGGTLVVTYTIASDWLPEPVRFSASFRRQ